MNINFLKKEVYDKEKKRLYVRTLLFNLIVIGFLLITLSGVGHNQKEEALMRDNHRQKIRNDSLELVIAVDLVAMKERENRIIRSALGLSEDTTYTEFNPNSINILDVVENQSASLDIMGGITSQRWDSINSIPMGSPVSIVDMERISDPFGWRKHPILKKWIFHEGTDFAVLVGSDVFATSDGVVERVIKSKKGYGNRIVINHGYGYKTVYAHLHSFNVKRKDVVKKGDLIGYSGNTGRSTGPHLHYEVLIDNRPVNPQQYFYYGDEVAKK